VSFVIALITGIVQVFCALTLFRRSGESLPWTKSAELAARSPLAKYGATRTGSRILGAPHRYPPISMSCCGLGWSSGNGSPSRRHVLDPERHSCAHRSLQRG
jgi:hypothetical protein